METPHERRLLQTIQARSKRTERGKTMKDQHNKLNERYLHFAEEAHTKELKRIEKLNQELTKARQETEKINYHVTNTTALSVSDNRASADSLGRLDEAANDRSSTSLEFCVTGCRHFPCVRPASGTVPRGAGFNTAVDVDLKVYERLSRVCLDEVLSDGPSIRRPCRSTVDQRLDQERRLQVTIQRNRQKRHENQPKDWSINYGKPVSKRKILNAPRPYYCIEPAT